MSSYDILTADTQAELVRRVNAAYALGWRPVGSHQHTITPGPVQRRELAIAANVETWSQGVERDAGKD